MAAAAAASSSTATTSGGNNGRVVWLERFLFFAFGGLLSVVVLHSHVIQQTSLVPSVGFSSMTSSASSSSSSSSSKYPDYPYADHEESIRKKQHTGDLAQPKPTTAKATVAAKKPDATASASNPKDLTKDAKKESLKQTMERRQRGMDATQSAEALKAAVDDEQENIKTTEDRLNILLFYADDWTAKVLGKVNRHVHTPNIDAMADRGVLFTNNCVITSVCWMSRATLVTGVYASRHRQHDPHTDNMFSSNPWDQTLFPRLKQAGYYTGLVGKWHAPQPDDAMKQAFDFRRFYYGSHTEPTFGGGEVHVTEKNAKDGIDFIKTRPKDKNFFLKVSFFATHAWDGHYPSYVPMNGTREKYYPDGEDLPTPKTATQRHFKELPPFFTEQNEGRNRWRRRFEPDYYQDNLRDLYSMATEVDWAVGKIMQELKEQDEAAYNKTVFIFTTDNGNLHGEHGLTEKWYPFEESLRVPLVIQDPRMPKDVWGSMEEAMTLNVDLTPTILGAAGLSPSSFMQGRNMAPLYLNGVASGVASSAKADADVAGDEVSIKTSAKDWWRKEWFYEFNMGSDVKDASDHPQKGWIDASFALVTKEWKYVQWPQQDYEQLYHRSLDPYDEWDLLHQNNTNPADSIQSTTEIYEDMKTRFDRLKARVQTGKRV